MASLGAKLITAALTFICLNVGICYCFSYGGFTDYDYSGPAGSYAGNSAATAAYNNVILSYDSEATFFDFQYVNIATVGGWDTARCGFLSGVTAQYRTSCVSALLTSYGCSSGSVDTSGSGSAPGQVQWFICGVVCAGLFSWGAFYMVWGRG